VALATEGCIDGNRARRLLGGVSSPRIEPVRYTIPVPVRGFGFGIPPSAEEELGNTRRCDGDGGGGLELEGVEAFRFLC
jgi:hypothetical protein